MEIPCLNDQRLPANTTFLSAASFLMDDTANSKGFEQLYQQRSQHWHDTERFLRLLRSS